jgi:hypothetical protein
MHMQSAYIHTHSDLRCMSDGTHTRTYDKSCNETALCSKVDPCPDACRQPFSPKHVVILFYHCDSFGNSPVQVQATDGQVDQHEQSDDDR